MRPLATDADDDVRDAGLISAAQQVISSSRFSSGRRSRFETIVACTIGFRLIRQSSTVPIVRFHFERIQKKKEKLNGRLLMAEVNKTQQTGSGMTDTNELQSTRTDAPQAVEDLKSAAGAIAGEYRGKAERTWDDARDRVRTFREDANQTVRENPTKAVFTALGIGFVLGLIFRR